MKKVFTLFAISAMSCAAIAQQIPNGGFENWTNKNPDHWGTYASATGNFGTSTKFATKDTSTGNHPELTASVKIISDTITIGPTSVVHAAGFVSLGDVVYTPGQGISFNGYAYTKKPDTLYMRYKYTPGNVKDTAIISLDITKTGTSLFSNGSGIGIPISNTAGAWKNVYLPLGTYYSASTAHPDTLRFIARSSLDTAYIGSTLWLDDIHFSANVLVVNGLSDIKEVHGINAYPNPANNQVGFVIEQNEIGSQVQLFDLTGREVYNGTLDRTHFMIDTRDLTDGIYAIRVNSIDKITVYNGKISISHK